MYLQKYSSVSSNETCILLRKWLFTRTHEVLASSDPVAMNLFYHQAVEDVSKGKIPSGEKLTQLRLLKAGGKKEEVCVCVCVCARVRAFACVRACVWWMCCC